MTKEQAEAFLKEMAELEFVYPAAFEKYGPFKACVFISHNADAQTELRIKPLKGIESNTVLWDKIYSCFYEIKRNVIR